MTAATVRCGSGMLLQHQLVFDLLVDTNTIDGTALARVFRTSRTGLELAARAAARRVVACESNPFRSGGWERSVESQGNARRF